MDISSGLIAKAIGGTAAVAAASSASYIYKDEIGSLFYDSETTDDNTVNQVQESEAKGINSLGLPEDCKPKEGTDPVECTLNADALKGINFSGRDSNELTVEDSNASVKLKVEKITGDNTFPENLKFTFFPQKNIDIKKGNATFVALNKDTNPEFKIKAEADGKWFLEKAWDAVELGKKVGLSCSSDTKECFFDGSTATNLMLWSGYEITKTLSKDETKKLGYEEAQKKYNQGFKFTVKTSEIDFEGNRKLTVDSTYEIKHENSKWYLKRVWSPGELAKEIGFKGCTDESSGSGKVCEFKKEEKINVVEGSNKVTDLKIASDGGKAKFEKGKEDYEWGFKITIKDNDVDLTEGNPSSSGIQKLVKDNASYEIKYENNKWYLSKKTTK